LALCLLPLVLNAISLFGAPAGGIFVHRPHGFQAGIQAANVKGREARPGGREACLSASLRADTGIESKVARAIFATLTTPLFSWKREGIFPLAPLRK
jgi:hypothetical protein